ncbi:hypothetical protein MKZ20_03890 [Psychrobacillus sp. FSL K6-2684]|uniref:hypothetical protein n=1 Tax=Psychrobacillus sp. FSL K6-2684 TaxID=2921547 RepID=UPI0030FA38D9
MKAENTSSWNITVNVTLAADVEFTNPASEVVTFDGYNYDLSGEAQANHSVKVYRTVDNSTQYIGTTVADSNGNWTLKAVNLAQDKANKFVAYQYAPGKDGVNGAGAESASSVVTINEGAFASTGIKLTDNGDNGLSVTDVLEFSFLNSNYGHKFNDNVKSGTITVTDGQSQTATLTVKKVGDNKLEVTKVEKDTNSTFNFKSSTISITSTSGVVNQDQLAYNVSASTGKTLGSGIVNPGNGSGYVSLAPVAGNEAIVVDGIAYPLNSTTVLKDDLGATIAVGAASIVSTLKAGDQVSINGNTITRSASVAQQAAKVAALVSAFTSPNATQAEVTAARTAFNALSPEAKVAAVASENTIKAEEAKLVSAGKVNNVIGLIAALPAAADVTVSHKAQIDAARAAYAPLTATEKAAVTNYTTLTAAEAALTVAEDTKAVADAKAALTSLVVTTPNAAAPSIGSPSAHANGATYAIGAPTSLTGNANGGGATTADPIVITRDGSSQFTFEVTVTITKGAATGTKVFVVTVPTGTDAVTVALKN